MTHGSKSDQEAETLYDIPCVWNLKDMIQMNLFTDQEKTHRLKGQIYGCWE